MRYSTLNRWFVAAGAVGLMGSLALFSTSAASLVALGSSCDGHTATLVGTSGPDELMGTSGRDVVAAGDGADVVRGVGGNDLICGGLGDDELSGGGGRDRLLGEAEEDRLQDLAGPGEDVLSGGPGNDTIRTGNANGDQIGRRILQGGGGADELRSEATSQADQLLGGSGADLVVSAGGGAEDLHDYPDDLVGGPGADTALSQQGNMTDIHLLGDGDHVTARPVLNELKTASTDVRLWYPAAPGPVHVDLAAETGSVKGSATFDTLDVEAAGGALVYGTPFADHLLGRDVEGGGHHRDTLHGYAGNDVLEGRAGFDWILGYAGDDLLNGGPGEWDIGQGGDGVDRCTSIEDHSGCEVRN
jgi:Ca2+-binding RTX toxin-like protein